MRRRGRSLRSGGSDVPTTSSLNTSSSGTVANLVVVRTNGNNLIRFYNGSGGTDF